jgi:glycosyltransferase involved in cell wall biosynthesis
MKLALVVPGGVDRSGEFRVIPALLALIERLAAHHEVHVFALHQEPAPGAWDLLGARVHNVGRGAARARAFRAILAEHRAAPFGLVQAFFSGACGLVAVSAARVLGIPSVVHVAGGEPVRIPDIRYGGRREPVPRQLEEPARLIHVASLNRVKDQPTLLRAVAQLAQQPQAFHLDIVGEDTLAGEIQGLARELGLADRVRFHGFMTQRQLMALMRAAHVLVVSSRHEAGPVAMLEAAALGVPTVGTAVGTVAEWSLAAALSQVLGDEELRLRLARAAWARAVWEDADYTASCFESLYEELAPRCRPTSRSALAPR